VVTWAIRRLSARTRGPCSTTMRGVTGARPSNPGPAANMHVAKKFGAGACVQPRFSASEKFLSKLRRAGRVTPRSGRCEPCPLHVGSDRFLAVPVRRASLDDSLYDSVRPEWPSRPRGEARSARRGARGARLRRSRGGGGRRGRPRQVAPPECGMQEISVLPRMGAPFARHPAPANIRQQLPGESSDSLRPRRRRGLRILGGHVFWRARSLRPHASFALPQVAHSARDREGPLYFRKGSRQCSPLRRGGTTSQAPGPGPSVMAKPGPLENLGTPRSFSGSRARGGVCSGTVAVV